MQASQSEKRELPEITRKEQLDMFSQLSNCLKMRKLCQSPTSQVSSKADPRLKNESNGAFRFVRQQQPKHMIGELQVPPTQAEPMSQLLNLLHSQQQQKEQLFNQKLQEALELKMQAEGSADLRKILMQHQVQQLISQVS